jgi:hypothetical protein
MMWRSDIMELVPTSILFTERCHLGEGQVAARGRPEPDVKLSSS